MKKKSINDPFKTIITFYRELNLEFNEEIKKVSKETDEKIKKLLFANSDEIYTLIQTFSDNFIMNWGPMNPRDPVKMFKDLKTFRNKIKNIN